MRTLFQKIWDSHVVAQDDGCPAVLYVDLHLVHEVTSPQAFDGLRRRGLKVRRPDRTIATIDHSVPTLLPLGEGGRMQLADESARRQIERLIENCAEFGIELHGLESPFQGIVHVIGPEMGATRPGMTIVCGDSHTATHGAFGALAFGIGTSEVEHVLATQCLLQNRPGTFEIRFDGHLKPGVTAKDMILALISRIGTGGGTGYVFEYRGSAVRGLSMEERMTICNMSIEAGARAGLISPDETTFNYLAGRPTAPSGAAFERAVRHWKSLATDEGAQFDRSLTIDITELEPMITFGTNPSMAIPITAAIPHPDGCDDLGKRKSLDHALKYMDLTPGKPLLGHPVDVVFIGSCTNSRVSDLRLAAEIFKGRRAAVRTLIVPGSQAVKREAEQTGLASIFREAGAEWREPGCSMCIAMNGDQIEPGQYVVSTSNRNFEGRQGKGGRTFLASPLTAAAAAVTGRITDARRLI